MAFLFSLLTLFTLESHSFSSGIVPSSPDTLVARNWDVEDGLPVNTVNSLIQDDDRFIWFTTYDGIVRFDGLRFKVYNHSNTPNLPLNRAVLIHEQKGVGIWFSIENNGVVLFREDGSVEHFAADDGFTGANVTTMMEDSKGRMWFGAYDGLFVYDGTFSQAFKRETPVQNRISSIFEDTDGSIWVSTFDGLVHLQDGQTKIYNRNPGTADNEFTVSKRRENGILWVGTRTGLFMMQDDSLVRPEQFQQINGEYVTAIYEDERVTLVSTDRGLYKFDGRLHRLSSHESQYGSYQHFYRDAKGTLWIIRNNGNAVRLTGNNILKLDKASELSDYHVNRITGDREGNIWLTTARSGIVRLKRAKATVLGIEEGLSGNNVLGLFEDSRGRFWVGTRDKGLNVIDRGQITTYREEGKLASDIVHSIAEDKEGNIWVGYYQRGVQRFTENGVESYDLGFNASVNDVRAIYVGADSTIWLGTYGGLVKFDPQNRNHTIYNKKDGLAGNLVRYIDEDPDGGLWIATADGGVSHFKGGAFTNYTTDDGLSSDIIRSIYVDDKDPGTIWVGTENNGLNRIRNGKITHVDEQDGLPDHIIHYISEDKEGWLWMSSNRGVFKVKKDNLNGFLDGEVSHFKMVHYGRESGMANAECNGSFQQGGMLTSDGKFWFSTQEGVAIFKVNPVSRNTVRPKVYIQNIYADGQNYNSAKVDFDGGINDFQIRFHALTFVTPEKTPFRYKLEGYDGEWNEVRSQRQVTYSDIPAGEYTFKVLAANNDGFWSSKAAKATINITPIFYERPWFYLLVLALLGVGYYGVSRWRYRYLMRRQEKMEAIIEEQTTELRNERDEVKKQNEIIERQAKKLEESNKTKDKFFSIIGHDLRSPFQILLGHAQFILNDYKSMSDEEVKKDLEQIKGASARLLNLVENLLNWASLQTEKLEPDPEWFNLAEIVQQNVEIFSQSTNQKNIVLAVEGNLDQEVYADREMINTIIRNLLSNAIKFTEQGGKVTVAVDRKDETIFLKVSDTGIGMSPKMVDQLMKLDEKTSRSGTENESGTGLGLIICEEMASFHDGEITVESTKNEGTTFTVTFSENAFTAHQES